ncbi:BgMsFReDn28 [Biomphalaria glabrata]|nr:Ficolin-2-like Resistant factor [Biomphalaria glabrata]
MWINVLSVALELILFLISFPGCFGIITFKKTSACSTSSNLTLVYASCFEKQNCRSFLDCSTQCNVNTSCLGVLKESNKSFHFHKSCSLIQYPSTCSDTPVLVYLKFTLMACGNGGTYNLSTSKCHCKIGWSGSMCDTAPQNCSVLSTLGYNPGTYWVEIIPSLGGAPKTILCELTSSLTLRNYIFSNSGSSYHNRTWAEYVAGYKVDNDNFWLGLDLMNAYAMSGGKSFKMEAVFSNNAITAVWGNSGVTIRDGSVKYQLTFSGTSSTASGSYSVSLQACLSSGKVFSTWDLDNDGDTGSNLASLAGAGWFFGSSLTCNPLGRLKSALPEGQTDGQILLPNLDMVSGGYLPYFQYVRMYFE